MEGVVDFFYKQKCRYCDDKDVIRIQRRWWMRIFIFTKCYFCKMCNHVFIKFFGVIVIDFGVQSMKSLL